MAGWMSEWVGEGVDVCVCVCTYVRRIQVCTRMSKVGIYTHPTPVCVFV